MSDNYSTYRINYNLRSHKRDAFIEFIKGQLMAPFALHARPLSSDSIASALVYENNINYSLLNELEEMRRYYSQVFTSIENLIQDHRLEQEKSMPLIFFCKSYYQDITKEERNYFS
jgi:IMP and pyridine-specific 5'-nucleotidase